MAAVIIHVVHRGIYHIIIVTQFIFIYVILVNDFI